MGESITEVLLRYPIGSRVRMPKGYIAGGGTVVNVSLALVRGGIVLVDVKWDSTGMVQSMRPWQLDGGAVILDG